VIRVGCIVSDIGINRVGLVGLRVAAHALFSEVARRGGKGPGLDGGAHEGARGYVHGRHGWRG